MLEPMASRNQSLGEEIANALSHALGLLLATAALPILIDNAAQRGQVANVVGAALFAGTAIVLYLTSTLYHALPAGRAKLLLNRLDHAAIYLFIAGSYMPFLLGVLRGPWGWALLAAITSAAVIGVGAKLLNRLRHRLWSTGLYVAMGWMGLVAAVPLYERMAADGVAWLAAGGVAYTVGAVVFLIGDRVRYAHFVWHLFVLAGTTCHFFAALWHAY